MGVWHFGLTQPRPPRRRALNSPGRITGKWYLFVSVDESFVPRADLVPRTELFWADEETGTLLATDSLAERVMRAGCTGVRFSDPLSVGVLNGIIRYRTATGVKDQFLG